MKCSLVITVHNALESVQSCLASIVRNVDLSATQLILVDDASDVPTEDFLHSFLFQHPESVLLRHSEAKGYLKSVNEGIQLAEGEVVTLLNSDTVIPQTFMERIGRCFESRQNIGVASPLTSCGQPFSIPMRKGLLPEDVDVMDSCVRNRQPKYPDLIFPDGFCLSIRSACLQQVGLFDEVYSPGYYEEGDFCMRAIDLGYQTVLIDNMYVYHKAHASFSQRREELMRRNKQIFDAKWGDRHAKLQKMHPKRQHKRELFCLFHSFPAYVLNCSILLASRLLPCKKWRRHIRERYQ